MNHIGRPTEQGEKPLLIGFVGFHASFNPEWNIITLMLKDDFPIVVADTNQGEVPEFLFFSVYGQPHLHPRYDKCVKIYTCEENIRPPWYDCDYAMSSDRLSAPNPQYLRLPIYTRFLKHHQDHIGKTIVKQSSFDAEGVLRRKTKFCNFVYSNSGAKERNLFFEMLSKYKRVDSGGAHLNNLGSRVGDKLEFLEDYKFTIAFENSRFPGYVSEKIVEPMAASSIPIYWGCRSIAEDFNPFSFVCANEPEGAFSTELVHHFSQVVNRIVWLDTHDDDYVCMMSEPWFHDNEPNEYCQPAYTHEFMRRVFSTERSSLPKRPPAPPRIVPKLLFEWPRNPSPPAPPVQPTTRGWSWADHLPNQRNPNVKR